MEQVMVERDTRWIQCIVWWPAMIEVRDTVILCNRLGSAIGKLPRSHDYGYEDDEDDDD